MAYMSVRMRQRRSSAIGDPGTEDPSRVATWPRRSTAPAGHAPRNNPVSASVRRRQLRTAAEDPGTPSHSLPGQSGQPHVGPGKHVAGFFWWRS
ncbi:hypothetical protein ES705_43599 [subsurface metagenome]